MPDDSNAPPPKQDQKAEPVRPSSSSEQQLDSLPAPYPRPQDVQDGKPPKRDAPPAPYSLHNEPPIPAPYTQDPKTHPPQTVPKREQKPPAGSKLKWLWIALTVLLLAGVAYLVWPKSSSAKNPTEKGKKGGGPPQTQVVGIRARKGNIAVYYQGLGSVTPIYTVTVKPRVDGELMQVNYREGQMVKKGALLAQVDPRPYQIQLEQAEGQYAKDQATLENARLDLKRYETLIQQKAIPEQQVATQRATVLQDEGVVKSDQAQIDSAKLNLVFCKITAPITGLVGLRLVDPGNIVHASDSNGLLVITQIDPISVLFTIAEDQLLQVLQRMRKGQRLEVDAFDRQMQNKLAGGTLTNTDNQIDQTTGTIRLRATFDNKQRSLFPNQFVNARLKIEEKRDVVLLPSAALQRSTNATFVYLVQENSTVTIRNVTVGTTEGESAEITSGLKEHDVVVLTGADKLQEGSKVNAQISGEENRHSGKSGGKSGGKQDGRSRGKAQ